MSIGGGRASPASSIRLDSAHGEQAPVPRRSGWRSHPPRPAAVDGHEAHSTSTPHADGVISDAIAIAIASAATRLVIVWHAGAVDADQAMCALQQAVQARGRLGAEPLSAAKATNGSAPRGRPEVHGIAPGPPPS